MKIKNDNLHIGMRAYVAAAIEFVAERAKQAADSSGSEDLDFYWVLTQYSNDLTEVPQYKSCFRELAGDAQISKHLDQNIGSYSRGSHTPSIEKMMNRLIDLGRRDDSYEFDPERFEQEYVLFEETFYSDVLLCEAIAPLQGLLLDIPVVSLSHETEISQLKEEEMKPYRSAGSHWDDRWCAVRVKYQLPKVIGDKDGEDRFPKIQEESAIGEEANERIEEVLNALRLLGKCDVFHSGIIHQTPKWLSIQHHSVANRVLGTGFITYPFGDRDAQLLKLLWDRLESPMVREELGVAVRRFGDSCVRHRNDDKLIDLMIDAEALFLRGTKEGEKGFRLALRAGQFLAEGAAARAVYDRMRLAYYYRSVLVHGGKPSSDRKLRKLDLMKFVGEVGGDIQEAIFKALNLVGTPEIGGSLGDDYWNRYLFGPTPEK
jgi:Apea-like HEPN